MGMVDPPALGECDNNMAASASPRKTYGRPDPPDDPMGMEETKENNTADENAKAEEEEVKLDEPEPDLDKEKEKGSAGEKSGGGEENAEEEERAEEEEQGPEDYIGLVFDRSSRSKSRFRFRSRSRSRSRDRSRDRAGSRSRSNTRRQSERMKQKRNSMPTQPGRVSPVMDEAEGLGEETVRVRGGGEGSSSNKGRKVCTGNFVID